MDFNDPRFNHTSRQGKISVSYGLLTEVLGQPVDQPNPDTMAEWRAILDGVPVTIYDRRLTETDWPLLSNADWRVGGHGPEALSAIKAMIEKKQSSQETTESSQETTESSQEAYDYCMNGCNDLCKKDLYELQDGIHGGSRWYCADCAGRHGTSDAFLRQDEEEPSPEPTA